MRRFPISWDSTLAALGFKRNVKRIKRDHYARKNSRFEPLEVRAMLSGNQPQYHFAVEDDAEYDPATQFVLSTEYDPQTAAPRAVLALRDLPEDQQDVSLQEIHLELRQGDETIGSQVVLVDIAEREFLERFQSDRLDSATTLIESLLEGPLGTIVPGDFTIEELLDVAAFDGGRETGAVSDSDAASYYAAFSVAIEDAYGRIFAAATPEDFEAASADRHALSNAGLLLAGRLGVDMGSVDPTLASAARDLRDAGGRPAGDVVRRAVGREHAAAR